MRTPPHPLEEALRARVRLLATQYEHTRPAPAGITMRERGTPAPVERRQRASAFPCSIMKPSMTAPKTRTMPRWANIKGSDRLLHALIGSRLGLLNGGRGRVSRPREGHGNLGRT
jgi:hypothetical protein